MPCLINCIYRLYTPDDVVHAHTSADRLTPPHPHHSPSNGDWEVNISLYHQLHFPLSLTAPTPFKQQVSPTKETAGELPKSSAYTHTHTHAHMHTNTQITQTVRAAALLGAWRVLCAHPSACPWVLKIPSVSETGSLKGGIHTHLKYWCQEGTCSTPTFWPLLYILRGDNRNVGRRRVEVTGVARWKICFHLRELILPVM